MCYWKSGFYNGNEDLIRILDMINDLFTPNAYTMMDISYYGGAIGKMTQDGLLCDEISKTDYCQLFLLSVKETRDWMVRAKMDSFSNC